MCPQCPAGAWPPGSSQWQVQVLGPKREAGIQQGGPGTMLWSLVLTLQAVGVTEGVSEEGCVGEGDQAYSMY